MDDRQCGRCNACCIWYGVDSSREAQAEGTVSLYKHAGEKCKFINKRLDHRRCGVYDKRPCACVRFKCSWLMGFFPDDFRPDKVGLVASMYLRDGISDDADPTSVSKNDVNVTIVVTDVNKCGDFETGPLGKMVHEFISRGVDDIRVVNYRSRQVLHFYHGDVYNGELLKSTSPEELKFVTHNPIGSYTEAPDEEQVT